MVQAPAWLSQWRNMVTGVMILSMRMAKAGALEVLMKLEFPKVSQLFLAKIRMMNKELGYLVPKDKPDGTGIDPQSGAPARLMESTTYMEKDMMRQDCLHDAPLKTYERCGSKWAICLLCGRRWKGDGAGRWMIDDKDAPGRRNGRALQASRASSSPSAPRSSGARCPAAQPVPKRSSAGSTTRSAGLPSRTSRPRAEETIQDPDMMSDDDEDEEEALSEEYDWEIATA